MVDVPRRKQGRLCVNGLYAGNFFQKNKESFLVRISCELYFCFNSVLNL